VSVTLGKLFLAAIRAKTDLPLLYVIFTHGRPDQTPGAAAFRALALETQLPGPRQRELDGHG